jgi:hypothetical protein
MDFLRSNLPQRGLKAPTNEQKYESMPPNSLVTQPFEGIDTAHHLLQCSARNHGIRDAVG